MLVSQGVGRNHFPVYCTYLCMAIATYVVAGIYAYTSRNVQSLCVSGDQMGKEMGKEINLHIL